MSGIVIALETATVSTGGRYPITVRRGEAWVSTDPIVQAHPSLFSADPAQARRTTPREVVEQSTRAPGEKSRARRSQV